MSDREKSMDRIIDSIIKQARFENGKTFMCKVSNVIKHLEHRFEQIDTNISKEPFKLIGGIDP